MANRPQTAAAPLKVLICDDDAMCRRVAAAMLAPANMQADEFSSPISALDALRSSHYDVVLMDLSMPEMNGIETTRTIRSMSGAPRRVPIIGVTAHAMTRDLALCLASGMNAVVTKPINRLVLLETIARMVAGPRLETA